MIEECVHELPKDQCSICIEKKKTEERSKDNQEFLENLLKGFGK